MRVAWPRLIGRLVVRCALVVATLLAVLTPAMATAAATVEPPLHVTTYDASTDVYGGTAHHVRARASDSRHGPLESSEVPYFSRRRGPIGSCSKRRGHEWRKASFHAGVSRADGPVVLRSRGKEDGLAGCA